MFPKVLFFCLFFCLTLFVQGQKEIGVSGLNEDSLFTTVRSEKEKLVLVHFFNCTFGSISLLRELDRTTGIYQNAKLKGGPHGLKCLVILQGIRLGFCPEIFARKFRNLQFMVMIEDPSSATKPFLKHLSFLWDCNGRLLSNNLSEEKVFSTLQQLVTR